MFPFSLLIFVLLNLLLRNHAYFLLFLGLVPRYHGADINVHVFATCNVEQLVGSLNQRILFCISPGCEGGSTVAVESHLINRCFKIKP